ncbi:FAD-dependent oxidoreductase [Hylemonella gracilis str. Niagara R]|uniref:FAD-dependent oxidoreductase n=1 Tax=Hylemonella gracilis str. Niagara R TaxID=1458275 RepID=A0A016XIF4_9BURK|nr:NAD(P)/FAD-dependent oxidoreductase [Hylemonella gracilis]EYC51596.1 FAD-dependent oxidoreductase [Hylemonella gracilis str. Niagara R]
MEQTLDQVDVVVAGAGVVGLAVARALAQSGREVLVLEAAGAIGTGTSSRNSEVIHAGLYYPTGSLKARLCVQGRDMLYGYCAERGVNHRRCGKLLVATSEAQMPKLHAIAAQAAANGVHDLQWLSRDQARALEPALECVAALLSPSTGIIDSHGLMLALQGDLENAGGQVVFNTAVAHPVVVPQGIEVEAVDRASQSSTRLLVRTFVNAAGLSAPALARQIEGLDSRHVPTAHYAKGSYFSLAGRAPFSRLIYPMPEGGGLGVHLTLDLGGQARFGPDAEWLTGVSTDTLDYTVNPARGDAFYAEVRRYWPGLRDGALLPAYSGVRPKISGRDEPAADFVIQGPADHGVSGLVNLFGIESPGLTSCLAIGEQVRHVLALEVGK